MSTFVVEGKWDDLVARQDLRGRDVQIFVKDDTANDDPWLRSLRAWADSHAQMNHFVDDSRDSIYCGTVDDSR